MELNKPKITLTDGEIEINGRFNVDGVSAIKEMQSLALRLLRSSSGASPGKRGKISVKSFLLDYIKNNPGAPTKEIRDAVRSENKVSCGTNYIYALLSNMARDGEIYRDARTKLYYPAEHDQSKIAPIKRAMS